MADAHKEFYHTQDVAVARGTPATVNLIVNDANTQAIVKDVRVAMSSTDQSPVGEMKLDGDVLSTFGNGTKELKGTQLVAKNSTLSLTITAESIIPAQTAFFTDENTSKTVNSSSTSVQADYDPTVPELVTEFAVADPTSVTGAHTADDGCYLLYNGVDAFVTITGGVCTARDIAGNVLKVFTGFSSNVYGVCTDHIHLFGKENTSNAVLQRINIATDTRDDVTGDVSRTGRSQNSHGIMLYHDGFVYFTATSTDATIFVWSAETAGPSSYDGRGVTSRGTYTYASGIVTTTDASPRTYLWMMGSTTNVWFEITQDVEFTNQTGLTAMASVSTCYGDTGFEIAPGIAYGAYGSNEQYLDFNTGQEGAITPVLTQLVGTGNTILGLTTGQRCSMSAPPANLYGADDLTYTVYAAGVEVT